MNATQSLPGQSRQSSGFDVRCRSQLHNSVAVALDKTACRSFSAPLPFRASSPTSQSLLSCSLFLLLPSSLLLIISQILNSGHRVSPNPFSFLLLPVSQAPSPLPSSLPLIHPSLFWHGMPTWKGCLLETQPPESQGMNLTMEMTGPTRAGLWQRMGEQFGGRKRFLRTPEITQRSRKWDQLGACPGEDHLALGWPGSLGSPMGTRDELRS